MQSDRVLRQKDEGQKNCAQALFCRIDWVSWFFWRGRLRQRFQRWVLCLTRYPGCAHFIFWHFPGYLNGPVPRGRDPVFRTRPVSVIRQGDWKLHLYHEEWQLDGGRQRIESNNAVELYNLAEDPGERHNLALTETGRRDELLETLLGWIERVSAPLPTKVNPEWDGEAEKKRRKAGE